MLCFHCIFISTQYSIYSFKINCEIFDREKKGNVNNEWLYKNSMTVLLSVSWKIINIHIQHVNQTWSTDNVLRYWNQVYINALHCIHNNLKNIAIIELQQLGFIKWYKDLKGSHFRCVKKSRKIETTKIRSNKIFNETFTTFDELIYIYLS